MNKEEKQLLREIKRDCLNLKRKGDLTEFGFGQIYLIYILENIKNHGSGRTLV